jgi:glycosyltransferase involved in cell wall biosynthesis
MIARLKFIYGWILFYRRFYFFKKDLRRGIKTLDLVCFFPFYHTGGAEKVHLDICNSFQGKKVIVFFTEKSANSHYLSAFKKLNLVFVLADVFHNNRSKQLLESYIVKKFKKVDRSIFGCHSKLFYNVCKSNIASKTKVDLIHAFTNKNERGFEKISVDYLQFIDQRVTISEKTKNDLINQYQELGKSEFDNRINVIYNSVDKGPDLCNKDFSKLKVLFVGRASFEKRVQIVGKIATSLNLPEVEFHLIGDGVEELINEEDRALCTFHGNITSKLELNAIYKEAHIILITSFREGIPVVVQEAMKYGVIPICTDVGGISELQHVKLVELIEDEDRQAELFVNQLKPIINSIAETESLSDQIFSDTKPMFTVTEFRNQYRKALRIN